MRSSVGEEGRRGEERRRATGKVSTNKGEKRGEKFPRQGAQIEEEPRQLTPIGIHFRRQEMQKARGGILVCEIEDEHRETSQEWGGEWKKRIITFEKKKERWERARPTSEGPIFRRNK